MRRGVCAVLPVLPHDVRSAALLPLSAAKAYALDAIARPLRTAGGDEHGQLDKEDERRNDNGSQYRFNERVDLFDDEERKLLGMIENIPRGDREKAEILEERAAETGTFSATTPPPP